MSDDALRAVESILVQWVEAGYGDECFWEGWPNCPSPQDDLTPNMVIAALRIARAEQ